MPVAGTPVEASGWQDGGRFGDVGPRRHTIVWSTMVCLASMLSGVALGDLARERHELHSARAATSTARIQHREREESITQAVLDSSTVATSISDEERRSPRHKAAKPRSGSVHAPISNAHDIDFEATFRVMP
jgi:hypothetical protein